jgi:hypothetical protein
VSSVHCSRTCCPRSASVADGARSARGKRDDAHRRPEHAGYHAGPLQPREQRLLEIVRRVFERRREHATGHRRRVPSDLQTLDDADVFAIDRPPPLDAGLTRRGELGLHRCVANVIELEALVRALARRGVEDERIHVIVEHDAGLVNSNGCEASNRDRFG